MGAYSYRDCLECLVMLGLYYKGVLQENDILCLVQG